MSSKILMVLRYLFAVGLLFFGLNKLFHFFEPPPAPEAAWGYWKELTASNTMIMVGVVESIAGLSLLFNKYAALMMVILMSVSVNAVLYHLAFDRAGIGMGATFLTLNIIMLYAYKDNYKSILK